MGAVPSTPRLSGACPQCTAEYLIGSFLGEKTFSIGSLHEACKLFATFVLLPFNYLVSSTGEGSRNPLADCRLHGLFILNYFLKCVVGDESMTDRSNENATADSLSKGKTHFSDFPYCKALENAIVVPCFQLIV
ncbi:PREDICTED: uncharacterized protein LOC105127486 [Populus euphratica]|uniref:Uncharacterized protein LOC105127486 n=1 Tax=Populus euphratica TaxID=75702 RepID=A0AAJ6UBY0_POPEU|nr:PREDICTED: uncharacterized protein LOC105127486 [Populus euphratica]